MKTLITALVVAASFVAFVFKPFSRIAQLFNCVNGKLSQRECTVKQWVSDSMETKIKLITMILIDVGEIDLKATTGATHSRQSEALCKHCNTGGKMLHYA